MRKKSLLLCVVLSLTLCWGIGQYIHRDRTDSTKVEDVNEEKTSNSGAESSTDNTDVISLIDRLQFENVNHTEENPWGFTAGIIDVEDEGKCIFLTPNTSVVIPVSDIKQQFSFEYQLHPWVKEGSDGAGLDIWILNENEDILYEDKIDIKNDLAWEKIQYSINGFDDAAMIKILCNNGKSDDDSADWVIIKNSNTISDFGRDEYVCSATYFANEWPINFWNSEMDRLFDDMKQIKDDGFNSIILVIPWKEFQVSTMPIEYNDYAFNNLKKVFCAAEENGLDVYTRIGYTWDFYNDENEYIYDRFINLMGDENTKNAWFAYIQRMYEELTQYKNFKDAFLTWEDFWGVFVICDLESEMERIKYADYIGYQDWLQKNYSIEEYNNYFGTDYENFVSIPVPHRDEPAMESMYIFYDEYLNTLLKDSQKVFPNLSIEVRMDADLVTQKDGTQIYFSHSTTYGCGDSDYTATMYSIPMGCENKGEKISAEDAVEHTKYILSNLLTQNSGKPVYVEQFLFMDNTPIFSYNAQIIDEQIDDYLNSVSDTLLEYTSGYGIWTYRDYQNNMIYNNEFALDDLGWEIVGDVSFEYVNGSNSCRIDCGDVLFQTIPSIRNHFDSDSYVVSFDVKKCYEEGELLISFGNETKNIEIATEGKLEIAFDKNELFDLTIQVKSGDICIDNIKLYSFVQQGQLYDTDNNEMEYIKDIRRLNDALSADM